VTVWSLCIKCVGQNIKVSNFRHICNHGLTENILPVMHKYLLLMIHLHSVFHIRSSKDTLTTDITPKTKYKFKRPPYCYFAVYKIYNFTETCIFFRIPHIQFQDIDLSVARVASTTEVCTFTMTVGN
jgi:hypothetical protein